MLILLSPSKGQNFDPHPMQSHSQPRFIEESSVLADELKTYQPQKLQQLMSVSENIATLNHERFQNFTTPFKLGPAKQAALAFQGDVYAGLEAETLSDEDWEFAQQHVRILSGLYGYLKPKDLIMPYRLEMKTRLNNPQGENLYQFWDHKITDAVNQDNEAEQPIVNLASQEYFKAIKPKSLNSPVLNIGFKDTKDGKTRMISFYAKKARGMMARAIIENKVTDVEQIKSLTFDGYSYHEGLSKDGHWVFERPQPAPKS